MLRNFMHAGSLQRINLRNPLWQVHPRVPGQPHSRARHIHFSKKAVQLFFAIVLLVRPMSTACHVSLVSNDGELRS